MKLKLSLERENLIDSIKVGILWNEMRLHEKKRVGPIPGIAEVRCLAGDEAIAMRRVCSFDGKEKFDFVQAFIKPMKLLGFPVVRDEELPCLIIQKIKDVISVFSMDFLSSGNMLAKLQAGGHFNVEPMGIVGWSSGMLYNKSQNDISGIAGDFSSSIVELLGRFGINAEAICSRETENSDTSTGGGSAS